MSKTVLITGASSGIGWFLADDLHRKGYTVLGLSRKKPNNVDFEYFECDLTDTKAMESIVESIKEKHPIIDVLVNCAGVGTGGALEEIPTNDTKWVFDVNVFAVMELTRLVLPALKQSNNAKIINVGSVAGEITIPYQVSYSMSKSSITRFSEGLRMELKPFKIDVTTVLPGDTKTGFTNNRKVITNENSPYADHVSRSINKMAKDEQNGVSPMKVVAVIERMMKKKRMPVQKVVGLDYKILVGLSKVLPKKWIEYIVIKLYG